MIIVISGPSGSGKSTIIARLKRDFFYSVSVTTRPKRKNECEGYDYIFVEEKKFMDMVREGKFLEYARVYGNLYGTLKEPVLKAIEEKKNILLDLDTKGSLRIKELFPEDAILIFIITDTIETLKKRLSKRETDTEEEQKKRIQSVKNEIIDGKSFDYLIVNKSVEGAFRDIKNIVKAEEKKVKRNLNNLDVFLREDF